ncbi:MAG: hypothetical protein EBY80_16960 [Actinobacteria bacterium]|nr:hypothetical protein [Actinomycetota bacterium]
MFNHFNNFVNAIKIFNEHTCSCIPGAI